MENITYKMAQFSIDLKYEDLPADVVELTKRFVFDSAGCAFGGSKTEDVEIMLDLYNDMAGKPEASVINSKLKLPMVNASLLNSLMIRALDYNDIYWEQDPSHPSGDTLRVWLLALIFPLAFALPWPVFVLSILMAITLSLGRITLGVHYPLDVIGGIGLGFLSTGIAVISYQIIAIN